MKTLILLFTCKDQLGIVARISEVILALKGNIISLDQHTANPSGGDFFMRVEFILGAGPAGKEQAEKDFQKVAADFDARFNLYDKNEKLRMGIMVSRPDHCLFEFLYMWRSGEWNVSIPFVISNYKGHEETARQHNIPFHFIPATKNERREEEILGIVEENSDFLVLARYMLVLSPQFLASYGKDIINIHHGFLPSFRGALPYKQALESGVKVIGATAHFVNEALDEGPIITQEVEQVSHKDTLSVLIKKGRNLEKRALADAVSAYLSRRIMRHAGKTVVF